MALPRKESPLAVARRAAARSCAQYCERAQTRIDAELDDLTSVERANLRRAFADLRRELLGRARGPR